MAALCSRDAKTRDQIVRELEAFRVSKTDAGNDAFNARTEADFQQSMEMIRRCRRTVQPAMRKVLS